MLKCAIYARVSTKREEQKNSLQNQIHLGESIAKEKGFAVVKCYIDDGKSGSGFKNRSGIQDLIKDAQAGIFDVVIAKSVSRLGREVVQSLQTADKIERSKVRLILPEDNYDTATSDSRLMFGIKALLAEEENAKLSLRIKYGLFSNAKQGKYKASLPPYGYKMDFDSKRLVIDESTAEVVKEIFNLYLHKNWGMSKIGNYLMRRGEATPRTVSGASNAGNRWHQQTIKGIFNNPVYIGNLVHHRSETTKHLGASETYKIRNEIAPAEQIIVVNTHPAIVSKEDFDAVQELMKKKGIDRSNGKESLFAHIAKCADCGCGMHYKSDRRNGAYICGGHVKHSNSYCTSHIISEKLLLDTINKEVKALVKKTVNIEKLYGLADEKAKRLQSSSEQEVRKIEKQMEQLNQQFDSLLSLHAEGALTTAQFKTKNDAISQQQLELANQKQALKLKMGEKKDLDINIQAFRKEVERFINLDSSDLQVLKSVLQRLIAKIEVHEGGKITIHYNLSCPS